eukprot:GHVO01017532.1.p1 GENE.GHVO01017532.1~~GHVO01017532.1.p1  ORF type:complete len:275 (+),score=31.75 GHVO01017532.1:41-826(+)
MHKVVSCPKGHHLYSLFCPSRSPTIFKSLCTEFERVQNVKTDGSVGRTWTFAQGFRCESACNQAVLILKDIGPIIGGQLTASLLPTSPAYRLSDANDRQSSRLFDTSFTYAALLRKIFGETTSVQTVRNSDAVNGYITFENGSGVSVNLMSSNRLPQCELTVWGTLGCVSVHWDHGKQQFEVQRFLKHFEHPSYHHPTGITWAMEAWLDTLRGRAPDSNSHRNAFVDAILGDALVVSDAITINFTCVTEAPREGQSVAVKG